MDFHGWRVVGISVRVVLRYIQARLFIFLLKYCLVVAEISLLCKDKVPRPFHGDILQCCILIAGKETIAMKNTNQPKKLSKREKEFPFELTFNASLISMFHSFFSPRKFRPKM